MYGRCGDATRAPRESNAGNPSYSGGCINPFQVQSISNSGGSVVKARFRTGRYRFHPDHGRIGQRVFNLSQHKAHAACLRKLTVADVRHWG
ncbi:hypothetical protein EVAR_31002_1 [Eumeta japonica]|uniref:Uncharacterized protein n=1 Tax=Eumeta variegata TaxID=151549 RepID=A0A4C1VG70_EUMVA|nr:hypothetical protein EVAR_31002_1 [Eumeta japonica]